MPIQLNALKCSFERKCAAVCPVNVLEYDEVAGHVKIERPEDCIECGACAAACPKEALYL
eukprot:gnl/Chilomastix_caulleri/314.p1 GENE.gnl/Chilomastix_caulleri/314~~gnl/Chilomastix_caulleri/314.p1  ORF type:complete len:60 (-),score=11.67 gnl/Chilomastix_caulleri/314:92-271(-)